MKKKYFFIGYVILLGMVVLSNANAQPLNDPLKDRADAKAFVQQFYDWYVIFYNKPFNKKNAVAADEAAIKKHIGFFEYRLSNAIITYEWEHNRAKGKNAGLGFDPFLAAKHNRFTYVADVVKQVGYTFLVDIHSDIATKSKQLILAGKTTIIAEVIKDDGRWQFNNFYYPAGQKTSNLMEMLASLRKKRRE
jgi:hypothetical protein